MSILGHTSFGNISSFTFLIIVAFLGLFIFNLSLLMCSSSKPVILFNLPFTFTLSNHCCFLEKFPIYFFSSNYPTNQILLQSQSFFSTYHFLFFTLVLCKLPFFLCFDFKFSFFNHYNFSPKSKPLNLINLGNLKLYSSSLS